MLVRSALPLIAEQRGNAQKNFAHGKQFHVFLLVWETVGHSLGANLGNSPR